MISLSNVLITYITVWATRNVLFIPFFVFCFWSLLATKLQKYFIIFVYILQGKMDKTGKNWRENLATKVTKYQKPKDENMG
jgi:hypothetical protein